METHTYTHANNEINNIKIIIIIIIIITIMIIIMSSMIIVFNAYTYVHHNE